MIRKLYRKSAFDDESALLQILRIQIIVLENKAGIRWRKRLPFRQEGVV